MDTFRIIEQEGYRREDLNSLHNGILEIIDDIITSIDIDNINIEDSDIGEDTVIGKLKEEFAQKVIDAVKEYIECFQADLQISFAENEDTEDKEEKEEE